MSKLTDKITAEWQNAANFVLGLWLAISPWLLNYTSQQTAMNNAIAVGVVIAVVAASALYAFHAWEEWINVALAAWLIASPWVLGFASSQTPTWNQLAIGLLVGGLALWSANIEHGSGGHLASR